MGYRRKGLGGRGESPRCVVRSSAGFTLVELLVAIGVTAILASLLLSAVASAKRKPLQIQCANNQRQIGFGILMYADDHQQTLPGPCYMGVSQYYYQVDRDFKKFRDELSTGPTELIGYLAPYLSLPAPPDLPNKAHGPVAVCPAFLRYAPNPPPNPNQPGYSYFYNRIRKPSTNSAPLEWFEFPFGYLDGDFNVTKLPQSLSEIADPAGTWTIMDADKMSVIFGTWRTNLPNSAVHGSRWNRLYFDGHVAAVNKLR